MILTAFSCVWRSCPEWSHIRFLPLLEMAVSSNAEVDMDSSSTSSASTQDNSNNVNSDDAFLKIQRAAITVCKIYNDYFALARADFISSLLECCNCYELRYICDMMVSIVKRKTKQSIGPLVECRGASNLKKENLLKDIYNLYSFGEGSIQSLPKNIIKCDSKYVDQCTQTDSCLSSIIFASKLDLDTLKSELMLTLDMKCSTLTFQDLPCQIRCFPLTHRQPFLIPCPSLILNQFLR